MSRSNPDYIKVDPMTDDIQMMASMNYHGVYLICFRKLENVPTQMRLLEYSRFNEYYVIYAGKSSRGFKERDYRNHFRGSARNSTLRKSIGVLMNLERYYYPNNKYRFQSSEEEKLSKWMKENLIVFYKITNNIENEEKLLIENYYPPLNIQLNQAVQNQTFRNELKVLRNSHI